MLLDLFGSSLRVVEVFDTAGSLHGMVSFWIFSSRLSRVSWGLSLGWCFWIFLDLLCVWWRCLTQRGLYMGWCLSGFFFSHGEGDRHSGGPFSSLVLDGGCCGLMLRLIRMVASGKCDFNPGVAGSVQILFSLLSPLMVPTAASLWLVSMLILVLFS